MRSYFEALCIILNSAQYNGTLPLAILNSTIYRNLVATTPSSLSFSSYRSHWLCSLRYSVIFMSHILNQISATSAKHTWKAMFCQYSFLLLLVWTLNSHTLLESTKGNLNSSYVLIKLSPTLEQVRPSLLNFTDAPVILDHSRLCREVCH